jgi:chromate reductase
MTRILGISGSLRRDSHNTNLLRAATEAAGRDVELDLYDGLKQVPPFDEDDEVHARPVKNAIDWISRPVATNVLRNKPVLVVGTSIGAFGAAWAQAELRKVLAALGARVLDVELSVPRAHTRFVAGELTDEEIRNGLADAVAALAEEIRVSERAKVVA